MEAKIPGGYALQPRKLFNSELWQDKPLLWRCLWNYLWGMANHEDRGRIKRGQIFTSLGELQKVMSYKVGFRTEKPSRNQLWCALEAYRETEMIVTTKTTRGVIITICNYDFYQDPANYERDNEKTMKQTTKEMRPKHYTQECIKNVKNEKKEKVSLASLVSKGVLTKLSVGLNQKLVTTIRATSPYIQKLLDAGITAAQIHEAVDWLIGPNQEAGKFKLVVVSGRSLYEKWDKIQAAMIRRVKQRVPSMDESTAKVEAEK